MPPLKGFSTLSIFVVMVKYSRKRVKVFTASMHLAWLKMLQLGSVKLAVRKYLGKALFFLAQLSALEAKVKSMEKSKAAC